MAKPNLLFILTDEQRTDTFAAYGNTTIQTPNYNRLAQQSVVFDRCYVTQPVCTPSRSTLMTGMYPHTTGCTSNNVALPKTAKCLPEYLTGYKTAYFGKWHLGDEVFSQHGFEHWVSCEDGYDKYYGAERDPKAHSAYFDWLVAHGNAPDTKAGTFSRDYAANLPESLSKPTFLAKSACTWLGELDVNQPFIGYISFLEPHMPFSGPRNDQYDPAKLPVSPNFLHALDSSYHLKARIMRAFFQHQGFGKQPLETDAQWRKLMAKYWGLVSEVDAAIGSLLSYLHYRGLDENTIIVFTSDHGEMMGSHGLLTKTLMFEESSRVPLLIHTPGVESRHVAHPVSNVDIAPTLLDLLGVGVPSGLQGQSLRADLAGKTDNTPRDVVVQWNGVENDPFAAGIVPDYISALGKLDELRAAMADPIRTIVTPEGWKLNYSPHLKQHELFNLMSDPYELKNVHADPANQATSKDLRSRLAIWGAKYKDSIAAAIA